MQFIHASYSCLYASQDKLCFFFFMVECRGLVQESDNLRIDGVLWELTGQTVTGEDVDFLVSFLKEM